jgi:hypothetical protein
VSTETLVADDEPIEAEIVEGHDPEVEFIAPGVGGKLLIAQKAIEEVVKRGANSEHGYHYATAADVVKEGSKALNDAGLIVTTNFDRHDLADITSSKNNKGVFATVRCLLTISDPDSGELVRTETIGTGSDFPGDKAIYKAMTGATKYAFAAALNIAFADDPEAPDLPGRGGGGGGKAASDKQKQFLRDLLARGGATPEQMKRIVDAHKSGEEITSQEAGTLLDALQDNAQAAVAGFLAELPEVAE